MKYFKYVSVLLFVILLFSACSSQPAVSVTLVPAETPKTSTAVPDLSAAVSNSQQAASSRLYSGPYDDDRLPMSVPEISETDRKTFNPAKVRDYLATSNDIMHDYSITGAELSNGKLYITVKDEMYFDDASVAYDYLKEVFSLADDTILSLPEFADGHVDEDGYFSSESGGMAVDEKILTHVPVSRNATVELMDTDYELTIDQFKEKLLGKKDKNENVDIWFVYLEFSGGEITSISQYQEGDEGDDE